MSPNHSSMMVSPNAARSNNDNEIVVVENENDDDIYARINHSLLNTLPGALQKTKTNETVYNSNPGSNASNIQNFQQTPPPSIIDNLYNFSRFDDADNEDNDDGNYHENDENDRDENGSNKDNSDDDDKIDDDETLEKRRKKKRKSTSPLKTPPKLLETITTYDNNATAPAPIFQPSPKSPVSLNLAKKHMLFFDSTSTTDWRIEKRKRGRPKKEVKIRDMNTTLQTGCQYQKKH